MGTLTKKAAIVGAAESDIGLTPGKSPLELMAQATKRALDDAGLKKEDIDGLAWTAFNGSILSVGEYLGIKPRWCDSTQYGGSSFDGHVGHAVAAIAAGLCETVLVVMGTTNESDQKANLPRGAAGGDPRGDGAFNGRIYGQGGPVTQYSMAAVRHMHLYGTTMEQLANVAVNTREWALLNPKAAMYSKGHLTAQDVLNSGMISYPLHKFDCCLTTDAGGAVIITTPERARNLKKKPVWILGFGEHFTHGMSSICYMPDITTTPALESGKAAMKMAGVTHKDIDFVQTYDSFTITTLLALEDLGFCKKGEGGPFFENMRTAPGGAGIPVNTSGGGLSYTHPGMFGMFLLIEAARQLRGECGERQVKNARIGIANGMGGLLSAAATLVLGKD